MQKGAPDNERLTHYLKTTVVVKHWIEEVLVIKLSSDLLDSFRNGVVLCYLMNEIQNRIVIPRIQEKTTQVFKLKENITAFLLACDEYGVHKARMFRPLDLYERKGEVLVIECLFELATLAAQRGFRPAIQNPEQYTGSVPSLSAAERNRISSQLAQLKDKRKAIRNVPRISPEIFKRRMEYLTGTRTIDWATLEKRLTLFQALARSYVKQKKYKKRVRDQGYREYVAREIMLTEKGYLTSLQVCTKYYRAPLEEEAMKPPPVPQNMGANGSAIVTIAPAAPFVTKDDVGVIFSNMNLLIGLSTELLGDLNKRIDSWNNRQLIGDLFLKIVPHLKIYTQYLANYNAAHLRLNSLKQNPQFAAFLSGLKTNHTDDIKKMDVTSYLIMPVQRVPRYNLLLRDLAKHTWPEHPDYSNLLSAADEVEKLANFLEDKTRFSEDLLKLTEISTQVADIPFTLAKPSRRFVRESNLPDQRQSVFLFNNLILVARHKKKKKNKKLKTLSSREEKLVYHAHLSLVFSDVVELPHESKLLLRLQCLAEKKTSHSLPASPLVSTHTLSSGNLFVHHNNNNNNNTNNNNNSPSSNNSSSNNSNNSNSNNNSNNNNVSYHGNTIELQFLNASDKKEWVTDYNEQKEKAVGNKVQRNKKTLHVELRNSSKTMEELLRQRRQRGQPDQPASQASSPAPSVNEEDEEELSSFFSMSAPTQRGWFRNSLRVLSGLVSSDEPDSDPADDKNNTNPNPRRLSWTKSFNRALMKEKIAVDDSPTPSTPVLPLSPPTPSPQNSNESGSKIKRGSIINRLFKGK
eukprot:TRINITY_DN5625_c0_g1_i2.p1 TRINITY_DN5625_c0_g1~~TRINITY_DN5625_c0_g1_i2.p1  ORF type:complete len:802 (-),score=233.69 TRINITY_DN5625_c0_g1_i2:57-2462(-)